MKKVAIMMLLVGMMIAATSSSYATETKDLQGIYEQCGLGGLLFPRWPVGASVSNFTWDFGSTASTSGLTTPDACKGGQAKLAAYIYNSYDSIEKDLAKGDGKYLDMLSMLSGKTTEEKDAFIQDVRTQFRAIVARDNYSSLSRLEKAKLVFALVTGVTNNS